MRILLSVILIFWLLVDLLSAKEFTNGIREHLRRREDNLALEKIEDCLMNCDSNIFCLWAKAEIFRRRYRFKESEEILNKIFSLEPRHTLSLITYVYIKIHQKDYKNANRIINELSEKSDLNNEERAIIFLLSGMIKAKEIDKKNIISKLLTVNKIESLFKKAVSLAPELPETHLGLGTFYLCTPTIVGGDIKKAKKELEYTLSIAPNFATAYARLAQVYKKEGDFEKYNFYLEKAKTLDPENEVVLEESNRPDENR